ncbi:hypothetical protein MTO96_007570 [Rhipicephalus appendiculatus]
MKGSSDPRRRSKQHESALTEGGGKQPAPDGPRRPSVDSAATGEGPTAMPFAARRTSLREKEVELTSPLEVDLDTATARKAAKLKKALRAKQRKEPAADTAEETTFKWSTSTMPSHTREMYFSTYRWGMSTPPTCEPCRSMKWGTSQMGRRASVMRPTPALVPSPPEPGRRPSVVRICPQSISLKESRPSDTKKKKKKKRRAKGKSVLAPASTITSAPATPFVRSPLSGTTGVTSLGTSPTASSAANLPVTTLTASQKIAKGPPAGASVEQSVRETSAAAQVPSTSKKARKSSKGKHKGKKHSKKTRAKGEKPDSKSKKKRGKKDEKAATAVPATAAETVPAASPQIVPIIVEGPSLPMLQSASEVPLRPQSRPEAHKKAKATSGTDTKLTEMLGTDACPLAPAERVGIAAETAVKSSAGTAAIRTTEKHRKDRKGKKSTEKPHRKDRKGKKSKAEGVAVEHKEGNVALVAVCLLLLALCIVVFAVLAVYFIFKGPIEPEDTTMLSTLMTPIVTWETTVRPHTPGPHPPGPIPPGPIPPGPIPPGPIPPGPSPPGTKPTSSEAPYTTPSAPTTMFAGVYECSTSFCQSEAAYLRSLMDNAKTPACVNFYEHVCGSWARNHRLAHGTDAFVSTDSLLQDELVRALLGTVQTSREFDVKLASEVYDSCMQRGKVGDTSVEVLREFFRARQVKQWPLESHDVPQGKQGEAMVWRFAAQLIVDLGLATLLDRPEPLFASSAFTVPAVRKTLIGAFEEAVKALDAATTGNTLEAMSNGVADVFQLVSEQKLDDTRSYQPMSVKDLISGLRTFVGQVFSYSEGTSKWRVLLPSRKYATIGLRKIVQTGDRVHLLNYMGFLAVIRMAAYMPDQAQQGSSLQALFYHSVAGRSIVGTRDVSLMCLYSTERLLPGCFAKAALQYLRAQGSDLDARQWIAQLVAAFSHNVRDLSWINDLSALLVRYRLKRRPIARLTSYDGGQCASSKTQLGDSGKPLKEFLDAAMLQQRAVLQEISVSSRVTYKYPVLPETHPYATFDVTHRYVRVPSVLFNQSVPTNSTAFALHLSRLAARFYQALVLVLFDDPYELVAPITEVANMRLSTSDLSRCLSRDAARAYASDGNLFASSDTERELLYRSTALVLAHRAFQQLLPVRRIWNMDFRYNGLPEMSSEQLFFVYFALDHCEESDEVHRVDRAHGLTPEHRVNLPLRSTAAFAEAFKCSASSVCVAPGGPQCRSRPFRKKNDAEQFSTYFHLKNMLRDVEVAGVPWVGRAASADL